MLGSRFPETDVDPPIRVVVTPSQSSYFAGEPFTVSITFTNTRQPSAPNVSGITTAKARSRSSSGHKRASHSISSAPLARPPTSPGTPRTAVPTFTTYSTRPAGTGRKGLIGRGDLKPSADIVLPAHERRKRALAPRSLSVTIAPFDLPKSASMFEDINDHDSPISPSPSSPFPSTPFTNSHLLRSATVPTNHPHARKISALDGQQPTYTSSPYGFPPPSPSSTSNGLGLMNTPNTSTSTVFSLALDSIAESAGAGASTSSLGLESNYEYSMPVTPQPMSARKGSLPLRPAAPIGLGIPPRRNSSQFPNGLNTDTELILYSYAQLSGTVSLSPSTPSSRALRARLLSRRTAALGGGSMDISSSASSITRPDLKKSHRRSFSAGLISLISPSPSASSFPMSPSFPGSFPPKSGNVESNGVEEDTVQDHTPLPTLEVQPAMIVVDLALKPGESRTYKYTLPLPANLPPTFKGRTFKLSYEFIVGTCRAATSNGLAPGSAGANVSRVMKVPVRVYNHVVVGRPSPTYDLLWPISQRGKGVAAAGQVEESSSDNSSTVSQSQSSSGTLKDLLEYAQRLTGPIRHPTSDEEEDGGTWTTRERDRELEREREDEGGLTGCREAVEILTRIPKKVSYDVNKDGVKVAVLTFTKSAYRLGETVLGVVEINERVGRARVLKLSAMLETQEILPSSLSGPSGSNPRHLRRIHAEHHSSFALSTLRTTFSLDIPSDASPAFQIRLDSNNHNSSSSGGLEWKVRLCLLVSVAAESSLAGTEGVRMKSLVRSDLADEDSQGEWGSAWQAPAFISPMHRPVQTTTTNTTAAIPSPPSSAAVKSSTSWASFLSSTFLGAVEPSGFHDGDELFEDGRERERSDGIDDETGVGPDGEYDGIKTDRVGGVGVGVNFDGRPDGWEEVRIETVECEVPIRVWPGNTAFKAVDVVFNV